MNEIDNVIEIQDIKIKEDSSNFFQVDFLKTFMIAFVIIDHSLLHSLIRETGTELWERMSIPVFLILLGFNLGN